MHKQGGDDFSLVKIMIFVAIVAHHSLNLSGFRHVQDGILGVDHIDLERSLQPHTMMYAFIFVPVKGAGYVRR